MNDFDTIYRAYFHDVYYYLKSLSRSNEVAEELTQQVFFKALEALGRFRGDCDIRIWLCRIAKNEYISYCRRSGKEQPSELSDSGMSERSAGHVRWEERLEDSETALDLHKILHTLDEPYKEVFSLRTFGELSFRQIAEVFGRSESWARVTYHRARLKIIEKMGGTSK